MKNLKLSIFLCFWGFVVTGQVNIDDVISISIVDQFNTNYNRVKTFSYELTISSKGNVKLWNSHQITRFEFEQDVIPRFVDSLNTIFREAIKVRKTIGIDSLWQLRKKHQEILSQKHLEYLDTISRDYIKDIDSNAVLSLIQVAQESYFSLEKFIDFLDTKIDKERLKKDQEELQNTLVYPLIGITIKLSNQEPIIFYCDTQSDLKLPWKFKPNDRLNYNPKINWALSKILPELELSKNKNELKQRFF